MNAPVPHEARELAQATQPVKLKHDFVVEGHLITADGAPVEGQHAAKPIPLAASKIAEREILIGRDPQPEIWGGLSGGQN